MNEGGITVYKNGFVLYSDGQKQTVFSIRDGQKEYLYDFGTDTIYGGEVCIRGKIKISAFEMEEYWAVWLMLRGEDKLEDNREQTETRRHFSYSPALCEGNDNWDIFDEKTDFVEELIRKIEQKRMIKRLLKKLTTAQKEIIEAYFFEEQSQQEIARERKISRQAVNKQIEASLKKMRKMAEKLEIQKEKK